MVSKDPFQPEKQSSQTSDLEENSTTQVGNFQGLLVSSAEIVLPDNNDLPTEVQP